MEEGGGTFPFPAPAGPRSADPALRAKPSPTPSPGLLFRLTFLLVKVKQEEWEGCWPRSRDLVPTMGVAAGGREAQGEPSCPPPSPSSLASPGASDLARHL